MNAYNTVNCKMREEHIEWVILQYREKGKFPIEFVVELRKHKDDICFLSTKTPFSSNVNHRECDSHNKLSLVPGTRSQEVKLLVTRSLNFL